MKFCAIKNVFNWKQIDEKNVRHLLYHCTMQRLMGV